ncbi:MAG: hypothetical protein R3C44_06490 [Chloroflexota bacterium]
MLSVYWKMSDEHVFLAYALVTFGPEEHVFPCSVIDDWGKEMTGLRVYEWLREYGERFPRADIFAVGKEGDERQHFLREFDLYARYPVYALPTRTSPVTDGVRVQAVLTSNAAIVSPQRIKRPATIKGPWLVQE